MERRSRVIPRLAHLAHLALLVAVAPVGCSGGSDKSTDGASETTVGASTSAGQSSTTADATSTSDASTSASSSSSTSGGGDACHTPKGVYDPWLEAIEPGPEPCEFAAVEACTTDDALPGLRECRAHEIVEDMTVFRWGPCMPRCGLDLADDARACGPGGVGISYCGHLWVGSEAEYVWYPCLDPACLICAPGDTQLCGPDTPYPETIMTCAVEGGVPVYHDGDCYT